MPPLKFGSTPGSSSASRPRLPPKGSLPVALADAQVSSPPADTASWGVAAVFWVVEVAVHGVGAAAEHALVFDAGGVGAEVAEGRLSEIS